MIDGARTVTEMGIISGKHLFWPANSGGNIESSVFVLLQYFFANGFMLEAVRDCFLKCLERL